MIFRIGSITNQFTAAAVMMLVDDGKVSKDWCRARRRQRRRERSSS